MVDVEHGCQPLEGAAVYSGRWPHVHFEVCPGVDAATSGGSVLATSQLALPKDVCDAVHATDGVSLQTPSMTGNVASGTCRRSWSECPVRFDAGAHREAMG